MHPNACNAGVGGGTPAFVPLMPLIPASWRHRLERQSRKWMSKSYVYLNNVPPGQRRSYCSLFRSSKARAACRGLRIRLRVIRPHACPARPAMAMYTIKTMWRRRYSDRTAFCALCTTLQTRTTRSGLNTGLVAWGTSLSSTPASSGIPWWPSPGGPTRRSTPWNSG